jgi:hypothetical protein
MIILSRLTLFALLLIILALFAALFRRLGLGEVALIAAVLALAFCVEIVRYVLKQVAKGFRGN